MVNVGKYTSPMDSIGTVLREFPQYLDDPKIAFLSIDAAKFFLIVHALDLNLKCQSQRIQR